MAFPARTPALQAAATVVERSAGKRRRPSRLVDSSTAGAARRPSFILWAARPRLGEEWPRVDGLRPLHRRVRQRDRPIKLRRPSQRKRLHQPRGFPAGHGTSFLKALNGGTHPTSERRPSRFRGAATARSAVRETISAPNLRWSLPAPTRTAEIAAAELQLLRGNSRDRCPSQSAQNPADADTTKNIVVG